MKRILIACILTSFATIAEGGELAGQKLLLTSVRTGDTEVYVGGQAPRLGGVA